MFWSQKPKSQLDLAIVDALNALTDHPKLPPRKLPRPAGSKWRGSTS
jgi:hypothetical protein